MRIASEISGRLEDLLSQMNLDEKIGQMTQVEKNSLPSRNCEAVFHRLSLEWRRWIPRGQLASMVGLR